MTNSFGSTNGAGSTARFSHPYGVAVDTSGNIYVADTGNSTIRKTTAAGVVSTLAGLAGSTGANDSMGTNALFNYPEGIAVDSAGNVYVADTDNHTLRKITPAGLVSTLAGMAGVSGTNNDLGAAARFNFPWGIALDSLGNVYVGDRSNHTIRVARPMGTNWVVSTIAGLAGNPGSTDGTNDVARFRYPEGVAVDGSGNIYVADSLNYTLRQITPMGTNFVVTTIAGQAGHLGYPVDATGTNATFGSPSGVSVDGAGNLCVTDNGTIRQLVLNGANWIVRTIGGSATNSGSEDGAGSAARFNYPQGIAADAAGDVYVADTLNNTIRMGVPLRYAPPHLLPYAPPTNRAQLVVTLLPPQANGQWRFPWELSWRNSGSVASNLSGTSYQVLFRNVPGWLPVPPSMAVPVTNGLTTYVTNQYYASPTFVNTNADAGFLMVNLGANPPSGAGWRLAGDTSAFFPSGYSTNLLAGIYLVEFAPVAGYFKPPTQAAQINVGAGTVLQASYVLGQSPPREVSSPFPVAANDINNLTYGLNGQLETDVGYGSGVPVQTNVVLTAAHLVFDDQTLSYVSQANWYFQREAGLFEPEPLMARGWYVFRGYAAQRTSDLINGFSVNQSSAESRNLDIAALYFLTPVAGGGSGGFLASDLAPNPWLTGTSLKLLVGYPVDGSLFGDASIVAGLMYQTLPQPYPLSLATDPVNEEQEVYTASWFLSYPGDSGGGLYVDYNGSYYPAGVCLETLHNSGAPYAAAVRAIDSNVVHLITIAQKLAQQPPGSVALRVPPLVGVGPNQFTLLPVPGISALNPGSAIGYLGPPAAVGAGAAWRLLPIDSNYYNNSPFPVPPFTSTNDLIVEFKTNVPGWLPPLSNSIVVVTGQTTYFTGYYTVVNPVLTLSRALGIGITGTTGTTYALQYSTSLVSGVWQSLKTNTLTNGLNLALPWPPTNGRAAFYRAVWLP